MEKVTFDGKPTSNLEVRFDDQETNVRIPSLYLDGEKISELIVEHNQLDADKWEKRIAGLNEGHFPLPLLDGKAYAVSPNRARMAEGAAETLEEYAQLIRQGKLWPASSGESVAVVNNKRIQLFCFRMYFTEAQEE